MRLHSRSIFVNCPFDAGYKPLFDAIVFTVSACGLAVRRLPGAAALRAELAAFEAALPGFAAAAGQRLDKLTYTDRMLHLNDFLASTL